MLGHVVDLSERRADGLEHRDAPRAPARAAAQRRDTFSDVRELSRFRSVCRLSGYLPRPNNQLSRICSPTTRCRTDAANQQHEENRQMGKFQIFQDKSGEYRWRLKAANGNIVATSGEGYKTKADAQRGVASVQQLTPTATIEDTCAPTTPGKGGCGCNCAA
jgi:uncharacterized protein YegP (UPF0339 family)